MAPPKRKSGGGRVTPKATRSTESKFVNPDENVRGVHTSSRYTPPVTSQMRAPKQWVPILMVTLLVLGMVLIIIRNLGLVDGNLFLFLGLACFMGGLFTATKWR